jgi:hypothetical protein
MRQQPSNAQDFRENQQKPHLKQGFRVFLDDAKRFVTQKFKIGDVALDILGRIK